MDNLKELSKILAQINEPTTIKKFFDSILTKKEIQTISSRWELVKLLYQGLSQRKISKKLNLSLCKITRGSRELKKKNSILKKIIKKYTNLKPDILKK